MIIALAGKIGCGKTTVAKKLAEELKTFKVVSISEPLKKMVSELYNLPYDWCVKNKDKKIYVSEIGFKRYTSVRELLQYYGELFRNEVDKNFWINRLLSKYHSDNIIIDDLRYRNEAEEIRGAGGILIKIEPYPGYVLSSDHISETDLDHYPHFDLIVRPEYGGLDRAVKEIIVYLEKHYFDDWK